MGILRNWATKNSILEAMWELVDGLNAYINTEDGKEVISLIEKNSNHYVRGPQFEWPL